MAVTNYRLMGIVNVTPDSFSDGGACLEPGAALARGLELVAQGAGILDVGGESTRPGAEPVALAEELRRVLPVIERLGAQASGAQLSIDTSKAAVAQAALTAGASLVNDVTALRGDPQMARVVAEANCDCCLMHMRGEPRTMQRAGGPRYDDVVSEVKAFLEERLAFAVAQGIAEQRILLDPGIGFGKMREHNFELLRRLDEIVALGRPVLIGTSRKSFLGGGDWAAGARGVGGARGAGGTGTVERRLPGAADARLPGTIATNVLALERGASVFRVHDVAPLAAALAVAAATLGGKWTASPTTS
jgi:dihydropteroate synthase